MIDRRGLIAGGAAFALTACAAGRQRASEAGWAERLSAIEQAAGGRLGAFVLEPSSGRSFGWRQDERFAMCSSFKFSLAAMLLHAIDRGEARGDEWQTYGEADLQAYAPAARENLAKGGMTLLAMAEAGQILSDNTAANLLLKRLGGPAALTGFWRSIGDSVTRLDRYEPELNNVPPGEVRDTTSPAAMAETMRRILLGNVLKPASRAMLDDWTRRTETGAKRIRGALPAGWSGGDKTGTGYRQEVGNSVCDMAILYPPQGRPPLIVTAYYHSPVFYDGVRAADEAVLRAVGGVAVEWAS